MYDELIERLREISIDFGESDHVSVMLIEAANAIEELQKQLREEKVDNVNLTGWLAEEHAKVEELQGELQALKDDTDMTIVEDGKTTRLCFVKKWIPVTERLPNCNGCYLVWRPHFFGGKIGMPSICYFDGSNTWHDSYGVDFERILHPEDVSHWMPLPQPPESEGE